MNDQELEREYSPSSAIGGNYLPFIEEYARLSANSRRACSRIEFLEYDTRPANTIEIALPDKGRPDTGGWPVLVFIHGGYWQEGSMRDSLFGADAFNKQGIAYAAVGYSLAPEATLGQIVHECRTALATIFEKAEQLGIDPDRIYIAGSSAGAHLCAMCGIDFLSSVATVKCRLAGVILLSGVFELEPLVNTTINDAVGLSVDVARELSPQLQNCSGFPPCIVSWGANETDEFKRQSYAFSAKLSKAGAEVKCFETKDRNHFDLVHDLVNNKSVLGKQVLTLVNLTEP